MGKQSLLRRLQRIDARRVRLLDEVAELDDALRTRRPAPDKWSIAEIVEHLVLAERDVLGGLREPSELRARPRTLSNRVFYHVVMFVLRFGIPVQAPSAAMLPTGFLSLGELRRMWNENHTWLRGYVAELGKADLRRPVFGHPVSGPLTVGQAIRMLDVHLFTHTRQIRRLRDGA